MRAADETSPPALAPQGSADLLDTLRRLVAADPGAPFGYDGLRPVVTRAAFWREASGVAAALAAPHPAAAAPEGGPPPPGMVGLLLPDGVAAQAWIVGALLAGRPAALLDARDPPERTRAVAEALGLSALLAPQDTPEGAPGLAALAGARLALLPPPPAEAPPWDAGPPPALAEDAPALVVPTSGSTGRPKGIVHSRLTLRFRATQVAAEYDLGPGKVYFLTAPPTTIAGQVHALAAMLSGALLLRLDVGRLGAAAAARAAEEVGGPTAMQGITATLMALLAAPDAPRALRRVAWVQASGTALLPSDLLALRGALPAGCRLVNVYGLTEAPAVFRWVMPDAGWTPDGPRVPVGLPIAGNSVSLRDPDGAPIAAGATGELVVESPFIALGEWQDGRLSNDRIARLPDGSRRLCTGDLARIRPDGWWEVVGRADRQVKIAGWRVDPEEIEDRLRRMAEVAEAVVLPQPPPQGAPARRGLRLVAAVAPAAGAPDDLPALLARRLRVALPARMRPAAIVALPRLPRLPGGKVDAAATLAAVAAATDPPAGRAGAPAEPDPRVARAWIRALGEPPVAGIGFAEAGGDSLAFLHLTLELERLAGVADAMELVHEAMDAAAMSRAIAAPPPRRASLPGARTLLSAPGNGGEDEAQARLREGLEERFRVRTLRPLDWRRYAREGARPEADARAALPAAREAFAAGGPRPALLGYSYGAAVALELARLLEAEGLFASRLVVLDLHLAPERLAPAPGSFGDGPAPGSGGAPWARWLRWRARQVAERPGLARIAARLLPRRPPPGVVALSVWRELELRLREAALRSWVAGPLPRVATEVVVLRSGHPRAHAPDDLGWSAVAPVRRTIAVPGDHFSMVRPPHRAALVAAVEEALADAPGG